MKKHIYIIFCSLLSVLAFASCDDRDEIRDDINALSARLDALQVEFDKLNDNINTFYNLANGKTYFTSYTKDDRGNYTLTMSDGSTWTVYSGMPEGELPTLSVIDGKWVMNYKGITTEIGLANPTDGKDGSTPQMSIGEDGYWYCQIGDSEPVKVEGPYNVAEVEKINPSIFETVTAEDDASSLTFTLYGDSDPITIKMLGGLDMTFSDDNSDNISEIKISIASGSSKTITAKPSDNVAQVVISPTPLGVKLEVGASDNLTITVPAEIATGTYTIYFEIFSDTGYRLLKSLEVTVTD